jgi:ribosomal protein L3 glutamine methyltransferase
MNSNNIILGALVERGEAAFENAGLVFGHGSINAFDEAAYIVLESMGLPIDDLGAVWETTLNDSEVCKIEAIFNARIKTRKPAAYLLNKAYIQGIPFYVDERVIIPRSFIAEILCGEEGFSRIDYDDVKSVLDLCTGSGCLAVIAAHIFPEAVIDAVDLSENALEVARRNVDEHNFKNRIALYHGDLFAPLAGKKYDLIITNPPYVDAAAMDDLPPEYRYEPAMALGSGTDGLDLTRKIIKQARDFLNPDGGLICEIGRGKDIIERDYPRTPFLWLDTEHSEGEVFWIKARDLPIE